MITKNEEKYLAQALTSVKELVDEIIIVDTGSTDNTLKIAKELGANIFQKPWNYNFAKARNYSLQQATKDWILVLDADEVIAKEDHDVIKKIIKDPTYLAYALLQVSYTKDTKQFSYTPIQEKTKETKAFPGYISCNTIRLFKNHENIQYANPVHESVDASIKDKEKIKKTNLKIHHYQFEKGETNQKEKQLHYLKIYEEKINEFTNKAKVYRDIGIIYANFKKNYEKAIPNFQKSLEHNPNNLKTYIGLLMCYYKLNKIKEALTVIHQAEKLFPESKELQKIKTHVLQMGTL